MVCLIRLQSGPCGAWFYSLSLDVGAMDLVGSVVSCFIHQLFAYSLSSRMVLVGARLAGASELGLTFLRFSPAILKRFHSIRSSERRELFWFPDRVLNS